MTTKVPVHITKEAGTRLDTLGMHRELEVMIEWVQNNVPDLRGIQVVPGFSTTGYMANLVVINAHRFWDDEHPPTDLVEWDWAGWKAQTFPPKVCANFIMNCTFQPPPAA